MGQGAQDTWMEAFVALDDGEALEVAIVEIYKSQARHPAISDARDAYLRVIERERMEAAAKALPEPNQRGMARAAKHLEPLRELLSAPFDARALAGRVLSKQDIGRRASSGRWVARWDVRDSDWDEVWGGELDKAIAGSEQRS